MIRRTFLKRSATALVLSRALVSASNADPIPTRETIPSGSPGPVFLVPVRDLLVHPDMNYRQADHPVGMTFDFNLDADWNLFNDVRKHGVRNPISVSPHTYLVIDGHRRALAAYYAGHKTIPCVYDPRGWELSRSVIRTHQLVQSIEELDNAPLRMSPDDCPEAVWYGCDTPRAINDELFKLS